MSEDEKIVKPKRKHKKRGRPKKPGFKPNYYKRRKKRLEKLNRVKKIPEGSSYRVCLCRNGKQVKQIGNYVHSETAYEKAKEILKENEENIIFPIEVDNNLNKDGTRNTKDARFELLILEATRKGNTQNGFFPNEFGKLIENKVNTDKWVIIDKFPYKEEETFWVWGYNPKTERKQFQWIYDNMLMNNLGIYDIKRVILYKNKILFKDDNNDYDIIFCKNLSDAVRFYNLLESKVKENKIKQVVFLGSYNKLTDKRRHLEEDLMEKTGWNKTKLTISGNR